MTYLQSGAKKVMSPKKTANNENFSFKSNTSSKTMLDCEYISNVFKIQPGQSVL